MILAVCFYVSSSALLGVMNPNSVHAVLDS
jgi:hypothetical protein